MSTPDKRLLRAFTALKMLDESAAEDLLSHAEEKAKEVAAEKIAAIKDAVGLVTEDDGGISTHPNNGDAGRPKRGA